MVYRTAQFSMTLTPNHGVRVKLGLWLLVRVRFRVGKVRKPYPNFQMVPLSMTLSDLWPTFQGHDNIQRPITRLTVSCVWSVQWFRFQWPWVTLNVDFKVTEMPSTNCVRSWCAICLPFTAILPVVLVSAATRGQLLGMMPHVRGFDSRSRKIFFSIFKRLTLL